MSINAANILVSKPMPPKAHFLLVVQNAEREGNAQKNSVHL